MFPILELNADSFVSCEKIQLNENFVLDFNRCVSLWVWQKSDKYRSGMGQGMAIRLRCFPNNNDKTEWICRLQNKKGILQGFR